MRPPARSRPVDSATVPARPQVHVSRRFHFDAAHLLPNHPGRCRNLHGHGYELEVTCRGPVAAATGMVLDFADIERIVEARVLSRLDHAYLNDIHPNPTAEEMAVWIWDRLVDGPLPLYEVRLFETPTCWVSYRGTMTREDPES